MFFYEKIIQMIIKGKEEYLPGNSKNQFLDEVEEALREWKIAENNFNFVVEMEFIDLNIYQAVVAQKKYQSLINEARKYHITSDRINSEVCG